MSFANATTDIELKTNFKEIVSKNKTDDIFRYLCSQDHAKLFNADRQWVVHKFSKYRLTSVL